NSLTTVRPGQAAGVRSFCNDPARPDLSTLSLHDALPIFYYKVIDPVRAEFEVQNFGYACTTLAQTNLRNLIGDRALDETLVEGRSEEHTSELQSRENLVCRLLLEKKNTPSMHIHPEPVCA